MSARLSCATDDIQRSRRASAKAPPAALNMDPQGGCWRRDVCSGEVASDVLDGLKFDPAGLEATEELHRAIAEVRGGRRETFGSHRAERDRDAVDLERKGVG